MKKKPVNIMLQGLRINASGGGGPVPSTSYDRDVVAYRRFIGIKDPETVDTRPDPNPVRTERDHLGNVTKQTYQAMPSGRVVPNADDEAPEE